MTVTLTGWVADTDWQLTLLQKHTLRILLNTDTNLVMKFSFYVDHWSCTCIPRVQDEHAKVKSGDGALFTSSVVYPYKRAISETITVKIHRVLCSQIIFGMDDVRSIFLSTVYGKQFYPRTGTLSSTTERHSWRWGIAAGRNWQFVEL